MFTSAGIPPSESVPLSGQPRDRQKRGRILHASYGQGRHPKRRGQKDH